MACKDSTKPCKHWHMRDGENHTRMLPRWKIMVRDPVLPMDSLRRSISLFTRSMKAVRSLLTPLLLANTARALHAQ